MMLYIMYYYYSLELLKKIKKKSVFITDVNITCTCAKAGYAWMPCYTTGGGARAIQSK